MMKVKVIDAPCGAGKTTWAIQEMCRNTEREYIYCTPFLDEITRIRNACGNDRFYEPVNYDCSKIDNFNELLQARCSVAVTHSTFLNTTLETIDYISSGKYVLILDEVLDVVQQFNDTQFVQSDIKQQISDADIEMLIEQNLISIDDTKLVHWIGNSYEGGKFSVVERLAKLNRLYYPRDTLLVCVFPPEVFRVLDEIYVMTYRFEHSTLRAYFELFDIPYELASVRKDDEGEYCVCDYDDSIDIAYRRKLASLVTVRDSCNFDDMQERVPISRMFCSAWWQDNKRSKPEMLTQLCKYIDSFIDGLRKQYSNVSVKDEAIMWTCPKDGKSKLKDRKRFGRAKTLSTMSKDEFNSLDDKVKTAKLDSFVPCNMKASNIYSNRWVLIYLCNLLYNPVIKGLFVDDNPTRIANGQRSIILNDDEFALSALIQWMCRSRLRNDQPIQLYLPSKRMRDLYFGWINEAI